MRVRNICAQNKVTKTITRTLCVLFFASALAQAKATDLIEADPSTWTDNLTSEKVDLINEIWKSTGNELAYSSVLPMALPEGTTSLHLSHLVNLVISVNRRVILALTW